MLRRLLRWWVYFRRGHGTYLVFLLSFANFVAIQYRLVVEQIPALKHLFDDLLLFAATFVAIYVPLAVIIGWLDYKRFAVPVESELAARVSPWVRDLAAALSYVVEAMKLISEDRREEAVERLRKAREILSKWAP